MRYKLGDEVKIKTWDQMRREFGVNIDLDGDPSIKCDKNFPLEMEKCFKINSERILTIDRLFHKDDYYFVEENKWCWTDDMIEYSLSEFNPINNRFEILDL